MNLKENFNNLMEKASGLNKKQLNTYRISLFFLICADIFGLYWFLHMKKLGIMLLIIFLAALGIVLYLESKLPKENSPVPNKPKKKEIKPQTKEGFNLDFPDSEEFTKRLNNAFEFKGFGCIL